MSLMSAPLLLHYSVVSWLLAVYGKCFKFIIKIRESFLTVTPWGGRYRNCVFTERPRHPLHTYNGQRPQGCIRGTWHEAEQNSIHSSQCWWSDLHYSWILDFSPNQYSLCHLDISRSPWKLFLKFSRMYAILRNLDSLLHFSLWSSTQESVASLENI